MESLPPSFQLKSWDDPVVVAYYWIKSRCRHCAVPGKDYQTIENLTIDDCTKAVAFLEVLDRAKLLQKMDNNYRRFIVFSPIP